MTNEHVAVVRIRVIEITHTTHGTLVVDPNNPDNKIWQQCPAWRFKCLPIGAALPDSLFLQSLTKDPAFDLITINPKVLEKFKVNSEFELPFYEVDVK